MDKYDDDVIAAVTAFLKRHGITINCPLCQSGQFEVGFVCSMPEQLTGKPFHVIPMVCAQCAYTTFLSASKVMGDSPPGR